MPAPMSRRAMLALGTTAIGGIGAAGVATGAAARALAGEPPFAQVAAQRTWAAEPAQAPARTGIAMLGDARLDYWDTGGTGETIVLLHPATGSNAIWTYQQPVFVRGGYRVIAYSRRGHGRSETGPLDRTGSASADLNALLAMLGVDRFHLVGSAAGGFIVGDYALSNPQRLRSMTIANSLAGLVEESWKADSTMLVPKGFQSLPADFRELSAAYRVAYPDGRARWLALEEVAMPGPRIVQAPENQLDFAALGRIATPTLILTGDCDLYLPPPRARMLAAKIPGAKAVTLAEAGHAAHWEQPDAFNRTILDFIANHRAAPNRRPA